MSAPPDRKKTTKEERRAMYRRKRRLRFKIHRWRTKHYMCDWTTPTC